MAEYNVTVTWQRSTSDFDYKTFDRTHTWRFSGGQIVKGSAAPAYYGNPELASPEAGLVGGLATCQMVSVWEPNCVASESGIRRRECAGLGHVAEHAPESQGQLFYC